MFLYVDSVPENWLLKNNFFFPEVIFIGQNDGILGFIFCRKSKKKKNYFGMVGM